MNRAFPLKFCCLLGIFLSAGPFSTVAQVSGDIIPPPPDAAALAKFIEHPVGFNTGIPQVSIPLVSWGHGSTGLGMELSLSYHFGGIKVEEVSGNVGLGWSITGLGSVSRSMRGLPDDHPNGFIHTPVLPDYQTLLYDNAYIDNIAYPQSYLLSGLNGADHTLLWELTSGIKDGQQDVFYFTAGESSGKFFIGKDKEVRHHEYSNVQIEVFYNSPSPGATISWFRITDDKGIIYTYEEIEYTLDAAPHGELIPVPMYASNWQLTKIEAPGGDPAIHISYAAVTLQYQSGFRQSLRVLENGLASFPSPDSEFTASYRNIEVNGKRVSGISFPDGLQVLFEYDTTPREDMTDYRLIALDVSHPIGGDYSYQLGHSYFNPTGSVLQKRLRLDDITKVSTGQQQAHTFTYHAHVLPARNANHLDYWGYAVSTSRNMPNKIPKVRYTGSYQPYYILLDGVDRSTDPDAVKAGSLLRLTYPTKGYTEFEMEANSSYGHTAYHMDNVERTFAFDQANSGLSVTHPVDMSQALTSGHVYRLNITETGRSGFPSFPYDWQDLDTVSVRLAIRNTAGTWSKTIYNGNYLTLSTGGFLVSNESIPVAGTYQLVLTLGDFNPFPVTFLGQLEQQYNTEFMDKVAGGLRVAAIRDYTDPGVQALERRYTYQLQTGHSSGTMPVPPNSQFTRLTKFIYNPVYLGAEQWLSRTSEPTIELAYVSGSPVLYTYVTEERLDPVNQQNNGRTDHEFYPITYRGAYDILPVQSGTAISWMSGAQKKTSTYSHQGQLLSTQEYQYQEVLSQILTENHRSLNVGIAGEQNLLVGMPSTVTQYAVRPSYPFTGYARMTQVVHRTFHPAGTVERTEDFTYDDRQQVRRHSLSESDGKQRHNIFYYAYDYSSLPAFASLVSANRIGRAVQTDLVVGNPATMPVISREFHQYELFGGVPRWQGVYRGHQLAGPSAANVLPSDLTSGVLRPDMRALSYDQVGNPQEVRIGQGPITTYLWGYGGIHPVARITHANFAQVSAAVGAGAIAGFYSTTIASMTIRTQMQSARAALTGSMVDDYTYSIPAGVTGITDPRGILQRYEYDGLLRLKRVIDFNGHIISDFKHHYRP